MDKYNSSIILIKSCCDADQIFDANYETMQGYVHKYYLNNPLAARFVRLHPLTWNVSIALRWEIYACAGQTQKLDISYPL
jgi:hypothetical protein